jgi:hypothetical protein
MVLKLTSRLDRMRLLRIVIAALLPCSTALASAQTASPPESLLSRGARARADSNEVLAIMLLDSAASSPNPAVQRSALFQSAVARFQLGHRALQLSDGQQSCSAAQEARRRFLEADSVETVFRSMPTRPCVDCDRPFPHTWVAEADERIRRYCR